MIAINLTHSLSNSRTLEEVIESNPLLKVVQYCRNRGIDLDGFAHLESDLLFLRSIPDDFGASALNYLELLGLLYEAGPLISVHESLTLRQHLLRLRSGAYATSNVFARKTHRF